MSGATFAICVSVNIPWSAGGDLVDRQEKLPARNVHEEYAGHLAPDCSTINTIHYEHYGEDYESAVRDGVARGKL
jgi:hypothetical protein